MRMTSGLIGATALALAATTAAAGTGKATVDAADWRCADSLIRQNYKQDVRVEPLAARIRIQCERPYKARDEARRAGTVQTEQAEHLQSRITFEKDIRQKIAEMRAKT